MSDGVTPRCALCGESVELAEHLERMNANQELIERRLEMAPELPVKVAGICRACREDPERCTFDGPPYFEEVNDGPPF